MTTYPISSKNKEALASKTAVFAWSDVIIALVVAGLALVVYMRTLTPGLLPGDGGEFQTLPYLWGHSHPTGYPVYLTAARIFALLPMGELAYRINLFSAVMGAVVVAGVYVNGRLLTKHTLIPIVGAVVLALSPTFWSQAIIAEVYTAGGALIMGIIAALLWWHTTGSQRALFIAGLLGGLSLGVHMSVALIAPAMGIFLLLMRKGTGEKGLGTGDRGLETRDWGLEISNLQSPLLGAAVGVVITILLFILMDWNNPMASYFSSSIEPSLSAWGLTAAQMDGPFERLLWGWQARQFQSFMWQSTVFAEQAADYWEFLPSEIPNPLLVMAAVGLVALFVKQWQTAVFLLLTLATQLTYFFQYEIWDLYVFYIPSYLLLALLAIAGMGGVVDLVAALSRNKLPKLAVEAILFMAMMWVLWPTMQPQITAVSTKEPAFDFDEFPHYNENLELMVTAVTAQLPDNAILFTDFGMVYPYYYAAHLQQGRNDLRFIETYPADDQDTVADSLLEFVAAHQDDSPIYFSERLWELSDAGFDLSPVRLGPLRAYKISQTE